MEKYKCITYFRRSSQIPSCNSIPPTIAEVFSNEVFNWQYILHLIHYSKQIPIRVRYYRLQDLQYLALEWAIDATVFQRLR